MNTMLCGLCNEIHHIHMDCTQIKSLKKKIDAAWSAIQTDYQKKIDELSKKISTCIDAQMMYTERSSRETWQAGIEKYINTINKRMNDIEVKNIIKPPRTIMDLSNEVRYVSPIFYKESDLMPYQKEMHEMMKTWPLKAKQASQKHLEKCLKERNERIKELEHRLEHREAVIKNRDEMIERRNKKIDELENHLGKRNGECQNALNNAIMKEEETKAWQREYTGMSERYMALVSKIENLRGIIKEKEETKTKMSEEYINLAKEYDRLSTAFHDRRRR